MAKRKPVKITVQQNDHGIKLYFNIKKDGFTEPLLGATVKLELMDIDQNITYRRICTITDPELGECLYVISNESPSFDTTIPGQFISNIITEYANGTILTMQDPILLIIEEDTIK